MRHKIPQMKPQIIEHYTQPHQFEPLLPSEMQMGSLLELAGDLVRKAATLSGLSARTAQVELRRLLRSMNSYYTNRIEGEHTRPSDIERALQQNFSSNASLARRQRLALAHIQTETNCEQEIARRVASDRTATLKWLYSPEALCWIHAQLFNPLPSEDLRLVDESHMQPGKFRDRDVSVGRHGAPKWDCLDLFLKRWREAYTQTRRGEETIVAAAAAHHRLAWIHPFLDGNGHVARLHTHLVFHSMGLTSGLWSPLRGYARSENRYKALLQAADEHRRGDLDGRGNLTQAGLVDWIRYTLEMCIDQVDFMSLQLDTTEMLARIDAALSFETSVVRSGVRREALRPLHYLFVTQEQLSRADFKTMSGLGDRLATGLVSALLKRGFLASDSPYGSLRFAIPQQALRFYFPALWPEAEQDQALIEQNLRSG